MTITKTGRTAENGKGEQTRRRIKRAAMELFARNGIEAVTVRDIVRASGQKNSGSINYHFNTRADLVFELIRDVAKLIDARHGEAIQALEEQGGPKSIREVALILVRAPSIDDAFLQDDYSLRFFNMVLINHRDLLFEAMRGQDDGTRRCMEHLRNLAPDIPAPLMQQRLMLVLIYLITAMSTREAARDDMATWKNLWGHPSVMDNLADTVEGMLTATPSAETLDKINDE